MSANTQETVLCEVEGRLATITLNRPERRNGFNNRMLRELYETLREVEGDDSVSVVLLTGAGRAFCPGADFGAYASGERQERNRPEYFHASRLLHEMPKVTIAAVNGACAGGGLGLACACDLRYASESAVFNTAFLGVALSGDMAVAWLLPRIVGSSMARELYFTSSKFSAAEAKEMGLVLRTFPDDSFRDEVRAIADGISRSAPLAIGEIKRNFVTAETLPMRDYVELEAARQNRLGRSKDSREAFRAFLEKRQPRFEGR